MAISKKRCNTKYIFAFVIEIDIEFCHLTDGYHRLLEPYLDFKRIYLFIISPLDRKTCKERKIQTKPMPMTVYTDKTLIIAVSVQMNL